MKHLIETEDLSSLTKVPYDRIILNSSTNDVIVGGGVTYEYVDLGLPSHLKWAKCNVGAEKETDFGDYFMWGSVTPNTADECNWANYKYCNGTYDTLTKYNTDSKYGTVDNKTVLDPEDDAATQIMGGDWRMPTQDDFQELLDNTDKLWTTINGVNGYKFTSIKEGYQNNSIFIPAAGYCKDGSVLNVGLGYVWSSSLNTSYPHRAWNLNFSSGGCGMSGSSSRSNGVPVRGVFK